MTIAILSPPRRSTSGRAPVFSATIRFWMSVDNLNRPPTLITIASSFNSSSMITPFRLTPHNRFHLGNCRGQILIDDSVVILPGMIQLLGRGGQAPPNGLFVLRSTLPQAGLVRFQRTGTQKNRDTVRIDPADLRCSLYVDVENYADALSPVRVHFAPQSPVLAAVDLRCFQKLPRTLGFLEALRRPKIVVFPVDLPTARQACCRGHGHVQGQIRLGQQPLQERGFTTATGTR